ncbi:MAG TPA: transglycosylase domain-containing protein [Iamia sp.]|nr:transglycosylase domain-containing protein [Iamia sp.]
MIALVWLYATVELPADPPELQSSTIVDADGEELAVLQRDGYRIEVGLDEVAPVVVDALIAAEDRDFRHHDGIDPVGIVRAVTHNIGGGETQGGSTITQQLVKNSYLSPERTYSRKVKEAILAIKLDDRLDKDEILERYLNTVYFGRGAYGIEAAANVYFDRSASELDVPQAALLVGLLRAPEAAEPSEDPETATRRRDSVIDDLVEVGDLTRAEADEAKAADLGAIPQDSPVTLTAGVGPHVVEWIRSQAVEMFGADAVYGGGLTIHTTIDIDDQRAAEQAVAEVLTDPNDPQAALVAIDPEGRIRAHVGGRDHAALQVDLARGREGGGSGRQPGSTFKPIVLAAALQDGTATLGSTFPAPASITLDDGGGPWEVGNYGGEGFGVLDLYESTTRSVNTVYAQLVLEVGPERAAEVADSLGIPGQEPDPSLVLGTGEVSVLDLAGGYSTLARQGERIDPYVIERVEDADDDVIFEVEPPEPVRALDEGPALAVTHALRGVIDGGTGTRAQLDRPAAGKTGTTQGNGDAWFAGYTPDLTAAVWMGYPEGPQRAMTDVHGESVTGGSLPADIWKRFMDAALADVEPSDFPAPPDDLLEPPEDEQPELEVSPTRGPVGTEVTVTGTGFAPCVAGWSVAMDPGGATSPTDDGGDAADRTATLVVPEGLGPGTARITALCDRGGGPEPVAEATFEIEAPEEESTTTTSSPTTTTTTSEPDTSTTAPPTTAPPITVLPGPTSTTTTTRPRARPPAGPGG